MAKKSIDQLEYMATTNGWVAGRRVSKGARLMLNAEQAKYENVVPVQVKEKKVKK